MKIIKICISLLVLISLSGCGLFSKCEPKDGVVCYDKSTDLFLIEEGAVLNIAVTSDAYGEAIVSLWDTTYPDYSGIVTYTVVDDPSAIYYHDNPGYDLIYISETELPMIMDEVLELDDNTVESFDHYIVSSFGDVINSSAYIFTPLTYDGFLFAYDETILNKMNISLEDSDNDGLPDSIDTWEEIFQHLTAYNANRLSTDVEFMFPFEFNEKYSFYSMLTAGDWQMFTSLVASDPGFDSPEFQESLLFIYDLGKYDWDMETIIDSDEYTFKYEDVLADQSSPMTMIAQWMYYREYETLTGSDYRFAHMPSFAGNILTPLVSINGYAISANTSYPSAANQLMTMLRSKAGLEILLNNTNLIPIIKITDDLDIEITDQNKYDMIKAYAYSVTEPLIALSSDTTIRAWQMYYDCDWMSVIKQLYDHKITVTQAQDQISQMADNWLIEKGEIETSNE